MDELEPYRLEAIRTLTEAVATDRLPVGQLESRLAQIRQAPNQATLDAIVADLLPSGGFPVPAGLVRAPANHTRVAPVEPAEELRISTIFGSTKRGGSWTVPLRLTLKVVMGELVLDLRDAMFGADVLDIDVSVTLGSLVLIVPPGAQVENECEESMSSSTHSTRSVGGAGPMRLLIRIAGRVRWSSIEIKEKRPSHETPDPPAWKRALGMGDD